ncbi:hypothetical protein IFR05_001417 [Cadophora sp. M221]|nr:hypothetical protein IFR05_001417 [Cadophora sp. M221]
MDSAYHSCEICQKIVLDFSEKDEEWVKTNLSFEGRNMSSDDEGRAAITARRTCPEFPLRIPSSQIIFDISIADIREDMANCSLYQYLADATADLDPSMLLAGEMDGYLFNFKVTKGSQKLKTGFWDLINLKEGSGIHNHQVDLEYLKPGSKNFDLIARAGTSAAQEVRTRPINTTPSSEATLTMVQGWLHECLSNHKTCRDCTRSDLGFMPTRLIEIAGANHRLYETAGRPVESYAALSYCWGTAGQLMTTRGTYQSHMAGIDPQILPATVRDAVEVTRKLGIKYIWIDSICIIQDDASDKAIEIMQMELVYSQATVTIMASRAKSVHEGFLQERLPTTSGFRDNQFQLPYRCLNGDLDTVTLVPSLDDDFTEPLNTRGWAMQERFLSARIIEYGTFQTRWTCQDKRAVMPSDGFRAGLLNTEQQTEGLSRETLGALRGEPFIPSVASGVFDLYDVWFNVVAVYCERALTSESDRLPAISGLASRFAGLLNDEYCAGLWRSRLAEDLLWSCTSYPGVRPVQYQAPSWSWAASNHHIVFRRVTIGTKVSTQDPAFKVLDCKIETDEMSGLFSTVKSGILTISGRLREALWLVRGPGTAVPDSPCCLYASAGNCWEPSMLPAQISVDFIDPEVESSSGGRFIPVTLLQIRVNDKFGKASGLVLRHIDGSEYSRLGTFELTRSCVTLPPSQRSPVENQAEQTRLYQQYGDWLKNGEQNVISII